MISNILGLEKMVDLIIERVSGSAAAERLVDRFVVYLTRNKHVDRLVEAYTEHVIKTLEESALLDEVVRRQTNRYLAYLEEHPEIIEAIVEEQSFSVAGSMSGTIRSRTVAVDNALESLVRRVLGRRARSEVPPPPDEVREQVLPGVYR
ncbi:MAG: hypothetical protein AAFP04_05080 [Myxococcota bacterium]